MKRLRPSVTHFFLALHVATAAFAAMDFVPVQEKAQGQSLAGSALLNDSLHSNPAGSAFTSIYALDATFQFPRTFAVSVLDTKTSGFGGAVGYYRELAEGGGLPTHGAKIGFSSIVSKWLGAGAVGKVIWGPNQNNGAQDRTTDFDSGVILNLVPFSVGFSVRNLLGGNTSMGMEREWSSGARFSWEDTLFLSASTTGRWAYPKPYQYSAGIEYMSPYYFGLKGGYRVKTLDASNLSYVSFGASINSPRLSFHYAVEFPRHDSERVSHMLSTTFQM